MSIMHCGAMETGVELFIITSTYFAGGAPDLGEGTIGYLGSNLNSPRLCFRTASQP